MRCRIRRAFATRVRCPVSLKLANANDHGPASWPKRGPTWPLGLLRPVGMPSAGGLARPSAVRAGYCSRVVEALTSRVIDHMKAHGDSIIHHGIYGRVLPATRLDDPAGLAGCAEVANSGDDLRPLPARRVHRSSGRTRAIVAGREAPPPAGQSGQVERGIGQVQWHRTSVLKMICPVPLHLTHAFWI